VGLLSWRAGKLNPPDGARTISTCAIGRAEGDSMRILDNVYLVLLFVGGILALSSLIVAKAPDARRIIDKLVPYQALIGVALLGIAIVLLVHVGPINMFRVFKVNLVLGMAGVGAILSGIALGFCFGMPQIAKWTPGQSSAEMKAMELSRKLVPYTMLVGVIMLGSAIVLLLHKLGLLKHI